MTPQDKTPTSGILFNWVLMNIAGLVIGTAARTYVFQLIFGLVGGGLWGKVVEGAVIGLAVGLAQQFGVPPEIPRSKWWPLAAIIGWGVGWSIGWSNPWGLGGRDTFGLIAAIAGTLAGLLQWWFILRHHFRLALAWVPASGLGWAAGVATGMTLRGSFGWPLAGLVAGLITGGCLVWLLQQARLPRSKNSGEQPSPIPKDSF
jgi:hypothetical protein